MDKIIDRLFPITEWDWLKVQMHLHALHIKGTMLSVRYEFTDRDPRIECSFYLLSKGLMDSEREAYRKAGLEWMKNWMLRERETIEGYLERMPGLRSWLNVDEHVTFQFLHDYGQGSALICKIRGTEVTWGRGYQPDQQ